MKYGSGEIGDRRQQDKNNMLIIHNNKINFSGIGGGKEGLLRCDM